MAARTKESSQQNRNPKKTASKTIKDYPKKGKTIKDYEKDFPEKVQAIKSKNKSITQKAQSFKNPLEKVKGVTKVSLPPRKDIKAEKEKADSAYKAQKEVKAKKTIEDYKKDYAKAAAKDDYKGMRSANKSANAARKSIGVKPYSSAVGDKQRKNNVKISELKTDYDNAYEVGNYKGMRKANNKANELRKEIGVEPFSSKKSDKKREKQVKADWDKMPAYNQNDIAIIQNASRVPSLARGIYNNTDMTGKVRDNTEKALNVNPITFGMMEGLAPFSTKRQVEAQVGSINTASVEDGLPYKAGYMGGMMGQYALTGGIAHGAAKAGITKAIPMLAGSKVGRGAASIAADALTGVPVNAIDSAKTAIDDKGKFDINQFGKNMAINTALDVGFGAGLEGVGAVLKRGKKADLVESITVNGNNKNLNSLVETRLKTSYIKEDQVPENMKKTFQSYLASVDFGLVEFVEKAKKRKLPPKAVYNISEVNPREIDDIKKLIGFDISEYSHGIRVNAIEHIEKKHGLNGLGDKSMKNIEDVGRIPYVLNEYDSIELLRDKDNKIVLSSDVKMADGKTGAPLIRYKKRVNGHFYIVEAVPDSKRRKLQIVSSYIEKNKKAGQVPNVETLSTTSKNELANSTFLEDIVPLNGEDVNNLANEKKTTAATNSPSVNNSIKSGGKISAIYTKVVDNQAAIGKAVKGVKQSADKDAKILTSNARNASGTAKYAIENGLVGRGGEKLSDVSTKQVFEAARKINEEDFADYLLHKHNIKRYEQNKPVFGEEVTGAQSKVTVAEYEKMYPEFIKFSDELNKTNMQMVDKWLVAGGLITKEFGELLKTMYPDYVPTTRKGSILADGYESKTLKSKNVIKSAVGDSRDILPPSVSIPAQMQRVIKAVRTNEAYLGLLDAVRKDPDVMAPFARLVDETAMSKTKDMSLVNTGEDIIKNNGLDNIDGFASRQLELGDLDGKFYVIAMENGKPVRMSVSKEVFEGFESLNKVPDGNAEKILTVIRKWLTNPFKALITGYNPFFALRNIARDLPTSFIQGTENNPFKWIGNLGESAYRSIKKDPVFKEFLAMGGKNSGYYNAERGIAADNLPTKALKKVGEGISWFNEFTETVPRFGEHLGTLKRESDYYDKVKSLQGDAKKEAKEKALLYADYAAKQQGIYNAGEVTVNFGRHGDTTKVIDSFTPYLNPAVQGIDKSIRSLTKGSTWAKGFGMLTMPTAMLYLINQKQDKESYDELDNRTKDNYYLFPTGDGKYIKIPKSRESGVIFATLTERLLRLAERQENSFKDFGNTVATNFAPQSPVENNIFAPLTYYLPQNKDFANRSIVPQSMVMDGRSKHLQYDETTSQIGKWLGEQARKLGINDGEGFSPKEIDYIIDSYTGIIGDIMLPATTEGQDPIEKLLTRPFTADVVYSNSIQNDFYEGMDKLQRIKSDKNILGKTERDWVTPEDKAYSVYSSSSKEMSELRDESRSLQASMAKGKDKDAKLRELRIKINDIALNTKVKADKAYKEYEKTYIPEISALSDNKQAKYREVFKTEEDRKQFEPNAYYELMKSADTNGSKTINQDEAKVALDGTALSNRQKAELWNAFNKSWKTNPYMDLLNSKTVEQFAQSNYQIPKTSDDFIDAMFKDDHYTTSDFGAVRGGETHRGRDIGTNGKNVPVYSPILGQVVDSGFNSVYGNYIIIDYPEVNQKAMLKHLDEYNWKKGETVSAGKQLGITGTTGSDSTGVHLHFEWLDR